MSEGEIEKVIFVDGKLIDFATLDKVA